MPPRTPPNATASLSPPLPLTASPIRESVPLTDDPGPPVERRTGRGDSAARQQAEMAARALAAAAGGESRLLGMGLEEIRKIYIRNLELLPTQRTLQHLWPW